MAETISQYEIIDVIGVGGFATVYKALDTRQNQIVALKKLHTHRSNDADVVDRFRREMLIMARLRHKNVVGVVDSGEENGFPFLVMEYLPRTLSQVLRERGPLPADEAIDIAIQILRALQVAHQSNVVHRDLKPRNVMVSADGTVKVADFGLAKVLDVSPSASTRVMGTASYISPEQAQGQAVDIRSDIYAVGTMLYEMLAGSVPFTADTPYAVIRKHIEEVPRPVGEIRPDVPGWLSGAVEKAMAKEPSDRYGDPNEAIAALRSQDPQAVAEKKRRAPVGVLAMALVALFLLIIPLIQYYGISDFLNWEANVGTLVAGSGVAILTGTLLLVSGYRRSLRVLQSLLWATGTLGLLGLVLDTAYVLSALLVLLVAATLAAFRRRTRLWI